MNIFTPTVRYSQARGLITIEVITSSAATPIGSRQQQKDQRLPFTATDTDRREFDAMVRQHQPRITRLAYRLLGWDEDVNDVVQDVFLAAWQHRKKFRGDAQVTTWLTTITVNRCRNNWRRRLVRLKWLKHAQQQTATKRQSASADEQMLDGETFSQVRHAVQQLPAKYREVTVLRYLEEMEIDQVAKVLKISRNTIDVRLSRARQKLKTMLDGLIEE